MTDTKPEVQNESPLRVWLEPLLSWVLGFIVLLALLPNILDKLNPVTGDEPFYLMTAISLIIDHDLDEWNNYAYKDYWRFAPSCEEMQRPSWGMVGDPPIENVPGVLAPGLVSYCKIPYLPLQALSDLPPHDSKGTKPLGQYTKHGLGLSFLIAPFFAWGGRVYVVIFLIALTALLGSNLWLLAFEVTGKRPVAWLTWAMLLFSSPIICYAFLIFPAAPAALFVTYAWRRLRLASHGQVNSIFRAILIGFCIGILPWLHSVYLALSFTLVVYWFLGGRFERVLRNPFADFKPAAWSYKAVVAMFLPISLFGLLFMAYYYYLYGALMPNTQDHAGFAPLYETPVGLLGLLFDQKYGLLMYAPVYLLALIGLWLMRGGLADGKAYQGDLSWLVAVSLPYVLVMGTYNQWWGEWCPPARYLVPILPILAAPLAIALSELKSLFFQIFVAFATIWSLAVSALFMYNPHVMYNWQSVNPAASLLWLEHNVAIFTTAKLGRFFPSFVTNLAINDKQPNWLAIIIWPLATLIIAVLLIVFGRTNTPNENDI